LNLAVLGVIVDNFKFRILLGTPLVPNLRVSSLVGQINSRPRAISKLKLKQKICSTLHQYVVFTWLHGAVAFS
jgi:hypothetical protein